MSSFGYSYYKAPKKKKKYSLLGYSQVPSHPASKSTRSIAGKSFGINFNTSRSTTFGGGSGSSAGGGGSSDSGYPAFYDPYSDLLAQLAQMRASDAAQLQGNLTGREKAIQELYAGQPAAIDANYGQALKEASAVNDAVHNTLQDQAGTAHTDLMSKLAMINAPTGATNQASGDVSAYYSGLGNANYANDAGDLQRLITRQSEEKTYAQKQPGIIAQQLESQYASDLSDLMRNYAQQELGLKQSQGEARAQYEMDKFNFGQQKADQLAQSKKDAEDRYWDNYWKTRDAIEHRWEIAQTLGQKKAALAAQKQMKNLDNKAKVDVANIRAGASEQNAQTAAQAKLGAASINATKPAKPGDTVDTPGSAKRGRVIQTIKSNILRPDGRIRTWNLDPRIPSQMAQLDKLITQHINASLRAQGIDPNSATGKAIRNSIIGQIAGLGVGDPRVKQNRGRTWSP